MNEDKAQHEGQKTTTPQQNKTSDQSGKEVCMHSEDSSQQKYRQQLDQIYLSDDQKQRLIHSLTQASLRPQRSPFLFLAPAALVLVLTMGFVFLPLSVARTLPRLPLDSLGQTALNASGAANLGVVGFYTLTTNPRADQEWPTHLPVFRYTQALPDRQIDQSDTKTIQDQLNSLLEKLQICASLIEADPEPYLLNSSIFAQTQYGRLDLINADYGQLFVNGSIPFAATTSQQALLAMENIIKTYPALFPFSDPVIELQPVRQTESDHQFRFRIYQRQSDEVDNLIASQIEAIIVYADTQGIQSILYPLDTVSSAYEYPLLTLQEVLDDFEVPDGYESPSSDHIWLIWKADPSGQWLIPCYRIYLQTNLGMYEAFDVSAVRPEYGQ